MQYSSLQLIRALAALGVVLFHAHAYYFGIKLYPGFSISPFLNIGYSGVEFFFVLSGFIMIHIHRSHLSTPSYVPVFFWKRFSRIMPFYWICLVVLLIAYMVFPSLAPESVKHIESVVRSFLLYKGDSDFVIHVAWTLSHELLFYIMFSVLIINMRLGFVLFAIWFFLLFYNFLSFESIDLFVLSHYNILFFYGIAAAFFYAYIPRKLAGFFVFMGVVLFFVVHVFVIYGFILDERLRTVLLGLFAGLVISGLVRYEEVSAFRVPHFLSVMGDASYSIYLVHASFLAVFSTILLKFNIHVLFSPYVILFVLVFFSCLVGVFVHVFIEKPLLSLLKRAYFFRKGGGG